MRVVLTHPLTGTSVAPPQVSWQLVVIQAADATRVIDPVLALARDMTVHFYQVLHRCGEQIIVYFDTRGQNGRLAHCKCKNAARTRTNPKSECCIFTRAVSESPVWPLVKRWVKKQPNSENGVLR